MRKVGRFRRKGLVLVPVDQAAREATGAIRDDGDAFFEVWKPRNMQQHKAYFATLNNVVQASGMWKSREALEFEVALALSRGSYLELRDGTRRFEPDSRAVASMSKDDFERLHQDTIALLTEWLGCDPQMLKDEAA